MITWDEACKQANYTTEGEAPMVQYRWCAMKDGAVMIFGNRESAEQYSKLVERVATPESKKANEEFWKFRQEGEARAALIWAKSLRDDYSELSSEVYHLCYDQAYQGAHAYGYDEIASHMIGVTEFAEAIIKAVK